MDAAELRHDPGLPVPGRHDDLRAGPDRGADRPGPDDQRADLAVEPVRQQGHPRQPHRGAGRRLAHLPPAGLPPVDRRRRSRSSSGSSSPRPRQVVWAPTLGESLNLLLAAEANGASPPPSPSPGPIRSPGATRPRPRAPRRSRPRTRASRCRTTWPGLIDYANAHFELAQAALRDGDFAPTARRSSPGAGGAPTARPACPGAHRLADPGAVVARCPSRRVRPVR